MNIEKNHSQSPEFAGLYIFCRLILVLALFSANITYSQVIPQNTTFEEDVVSGRVRDVATGDYLPGVLVRIQTGYEGFSYSALTDTLGYFVFRDLPDNTFNLTIEQNGFLQYDYSFRYSGKGSLNLWVIGLVPENINVGEVTVKSTKILVQYEADKITYRVQDDPLAKSATLLQILRKVPGIEVEGNRDITLNGSSSFLVLVNGRKSSLFVHDPADVFRSFPAAAVKSIEILPSPPSRYESEGTGGVINLVLDQYTINGYRGNINAQISEPYDFSPGGYLTAKSGIFGVNTYANYNTGRDPAGKSGDLISDKAFETVTTSSGNNMGDYKSLNYSAEFNITPDNRNLLVFSVSQRGSKNNSKGTLYLEETGTEDLFFENYESVHQGYYERDYATFQGDYELRPGGTGKHLLTFSIRKVTSDYENNQEYYVNNIITRLSEISLTGQSDSYSEYTFQADYVLTLKNHSLEAGIKNIRRDSKSDYSHQDWDEERQIFATDPGNSNRFSFSQNIGGGYASLSLRFGNFNVRMGARTEPVRLDVDYQSTETQINKVYYNFIPSLRVGGRFGNAGRFNLAYTQRVQRPGLMYLNPYVNKSEVYYHYYGNPDLDPAVSGVYTLNYFLQRGKSGYSVMINHSSSRNSIQSYYYIGADSILYSTFANIGKSANSGVHLTFSRSLFDAISLNAGFGTREYRYSGRRGDREFTNKGTTWSANVNIGVSLWEDGYLNGSARWNSGSVNLQGNTNGSFHNSISFSWDPWFSKNLSLDVSADNLFRNYRIDRYTADNDRFYMVSESRERISIYTLSANLRFGQFRGTLKRKQRDIINDDQVE